MAVNGLYVVQGEANAVTALLKKAHRGWQHQQQQIHLGHSLLDDTDPLLRNFADLRDVLSSVGVFDLISLLCTKIWGAPHTPSSDW